ncbi:MAG: DUF2441 domain-containing protein [Sphingomonas sp.]
MSEQFSHPIGRFNLLRGTHFHLTEVSGSLVLHNARLDKGLLRSASFIAQSTELSGATTRYAECNAHQTKESAWEHVRATEFPERPSRIKSFYCFDKLEDAATANQSWFASAPRRIVELRILEGSNIARADSKWLDCEPEKWADYARAYWAGESTQQPLFETIVSGCVCFPDWESFPLLGS